MKVLAQEYAADSSHPVRVVGIDPGPSTSAVRCRFSGASAMKCYVVMRVLWDFGAGNGTSV